MTIAVFAREQKVKIAAIVPALPSTTAGQPAIMLDLGALNARTLDDGSLPQTLTEWWLSAGGGTGPALKALAAHPSWSTGTVDRASLRAELEKAPLGAALPGALILGFVAALAFALIGFAVNAIVSARERRTEFVIMRALGASGRQLFGLLGIEQAILIAFGLLGGVGLGVTMARLVIPHIVLTVRATAPYPPVELTVPWGWVAALVAGVTALLLGVLVVLGRGMRKGLDGGGPGSAARLGEDR
jgi:predicted lysophospholipase L1 biosynthesis ABC-type transport system permease subunit